MDKFLNTLTLFPGEYPYDAVITLLVFLVGIPALVLQFMAPDVRRVTMGRFIIPREVLRRLILSVLVIFACTGIAWWKTAYKDFALAVMLAILFGIVAITTIQIQYRYGWRETIISSLRDKALLNLNDNGQLDESALQLILEIGKQSDAGSDREVVLESINHIVSITSSHRLYDGDALGSLMDGLVKMLANQPSPEDTSNYQLAVSILISILSAPRADRLIDQQHAVRALSALGQSLLAEISVNVGTDHIMMDYEEALWLAVARHPTMQTDVTQSLLEVGSVALDNHHYLFAVAACERLLTIVEENEPSHEALSDLLGLLAHFWTDGKSSKDFSETRFDRVMNCVKRADFSSLDGAIQYANMHSKITMRFLTADKLAKMAGDLEPKPKPRRKK